jgi:hypothetical protein
VDGGSPITAAAQEEDSVYCFSFFGAAYDSRHLTGETCAGLDWGAERLESGSMCWVVFGREQLRRMLGVTSGGGVFGGEGPSTSRKMQDEASNKTVDNKVHFEAARDGEVGNLYREIGATKH